MPWGELAAWRATNPRELAEDTVSLSAHKQTSGFGVRQKSLRSCWQHGATRPMHNRGREVASRQAPPLFGHDLTGYAPSPTLY